MNHGGAIDHILRRLAEELPAHLTYHGHHHTIDVLEATERIATAEGVSDSEIDMVLVAAAYHDCGFLFGHEDHEKQGCEIAKQTLPDYGFADSDIDWVCKMIMATRVPQQPQEHLSRILCDADLDYLGRDDFEPVSRSLFQELNKLNVVNDVKAWNRIQLNFLSQHCYHTDYGKTLRQPQKQKHLDKIKVIVSGYAD
jgi:predicted metal-dependent HD superfamily phosphohydrolase